MNALRGSSERDTVGRDRALLGFCSCFLSTICHADCIVAAPAIDYLVLDTIIVVPDHFHGIITLPDGIRDPSKKIKPLSQLIGAFTKSSVKSVTKVRACRTAVTCRRLDNRGLMDTTSYQFRTPPCPPAARKGPSRLSETRPAQGEGRGGRLPLTFERENGN